MFVSVNELVIGYKLTRIKTVKSHKDECTSLLARVERLKAQLAHEQGRVDRRKERLARERALVATEREQRVALERRLARSKLIQTIDQQLRSAFELSS